MLEGLKLSGPARFVGAPAAFPTAHRVCALFLRWAYSVASRQNETGGALARRAVLAAVVHDVGHPGLSNGHLCTARSALGIHPIATPEKQRPNSIGNLGESGGAVL
jgi:hypothetical protein